MVYQSIKAFWDTKKYTMYGLASFLFAFLAQTLLYIANPFINFLNLETLHISQEYAITGGLLCYGIALFLFYCGRKAWKDKSSFLPDIYTSSSSQNPIYNKLLVISLTLSAVITLILFHFLVLKNIYSPYLFYLWGFSILLPASILLLQEKQIIKKLFSSIRKEEIFFLCAAVVFIITLYGYKIDLIPYRIHGDEAMMGNVARDYFRQTVNIFSYGPWFSVPYMSFFPISFSMKLFGDDIIGVRYSSLLVALLSLPFFYFMIRNLFNRKIAAFSVIIFYSLSTSIAFFRTGFHYTQGILAVVLALFFFMLVLKHNSRFGSFMTGIVAGLGFYLYFSARAILPLLIVFFLYMIIFQQKKFTRILYLSLFFFLGLIISITPNVFESIKDPAVFSNRTNEVFVLSETGSEYIKKEVNSSSLALAVVKNTIKAFQSYHYRLDCSGQYSIERPFIDFLPSIFLVYGLFITLIRIKHPNFAILALSFLLVTFLGWGLTINTPFFPRMVILLPVIAVLIALGLYHLIILTFNSVLNIAITINIKKEISLIFVILIIASGFEGYFIEYIAKNTNFSLTDKFRIASSFLEKNYANYIYIPLYYEKLGKHYKVDLQYPTIAFLTAFSPPVTERELSDHKPPVDTKVSKDVGFVIEGSVYEQLLPVLQTFYPNGKLILTKFNLIHTDFVLYYVSKEDIKAKIPTEKESHD